jgi:hypothetical protein
VKQGTEVLPAVKAFLLAHHHPLKMLLLILTAPHTPAAGRSLGFFDGQQNQKRKKNNLATTSSVATFSKRMYSKEHGVEDFFSFPRPLYHIKAPDR